MSRGRFIGDGGSLPVVMRRGGRGSCMLCGFRSGDRGSGPTRAYPRGAIFLWRGNWTVAVSLLSIILLNLF
jgi:hypothetical protein